MKHRYLEVTFRRGRPLAGYLYLPRPSGTKVARTTDEGYGLRVDYGSDGTPLGIEITAPAAVDLDGINAVLAKLGQPPLTDEEWAPAKAA